MSILFPGFAKWKELNTKNAQEESRKDCYSICNLLPTELLGVLPSCKNSLKRVRAFQIKLEFSSVGF